MMMDEVAKRVHHCRAYPRTKEKLNQHHLTSFNRVAKHVEPFKPQHHYSNSPY